jgi:hypothetical protein
VNGKRAALVIFWVAVGLAACNGGTPQSPTTPSTLKPPPPAPPGGVTLGVLRDYTLSGVVFEMTPTGKMPIQGVDVYCEPCGAETHSWSTTDENGFYSFTGVWNAGVFATPISVQKDGYTDPGGVETTPPNPQGPGWREVMVNGDTRFDVELVRR